MKKRKIIFLKLAVFFCLIFTNLTSAFAVNVLWLNDPDTRSIFENGLENMTDKFHNNHRRSKRMLWSVMNINLDEGNIYFNDEEFKIFVEMNGRTLLKYNTPRSCKTLISKSKRLLFGTAVKENLMEYFPIIEFDDLRYFVHFKAKVDSWIIMDSDGKVTDIDPDEDIEDIPEEAVKYKTTSCSNNIMSKKIFYDIKSIK